MKLRKQYKSPKEAETAFSVNQEGNPAVQEEPSASGLIDTLGSLAISHVRQVHFVIASILDQPKHVLLKQGWVNRRGNL